MKNIPIINWASSALLVSTILTGCNEEKQRPNVLFICVDDLRRELGCYGSEVKSPNMDRLANEGSLFFHHYVSPVLSNSSLCLQTLLYSFSFFE